MSYRHLVEPWLTSICSYVGKNGFGTVATDLFAPHMPEEPVTCTAVVPTGGIRSGGNPVRRRLVQIQHRRPFEDLGSGLTFIGSLSGLFDDQWNKLDADHLGRFELQSEPGRYILDGAGNVIFSLDYVFTST